MAFDGSRAVGMTMMLIRQLDVGGEKIQAGYWANLYVHPEYRQYFLYPRLTRAMTEALRKHDLAILYTAVRHADVARAHVKLGFAKLGELAVRAKPLRPMRLLLRAKAWTVPDQFAAVPDYLYRRASQLCRNRTDLNVDEMTLPSDLHQFASLLDQARSPVRQVCSRRRLEERYGATREGEPYSLLGVRRRGILIAAALWRAAARGDNRVRAGVLMDVAFQSGEDRAARKVIAAAEERALEKSCDVMLHLDGVKEARPLIKRSGYFLAPERYSILLWPAQAAKAGGLADLQSWRYPFAEHDTF
jgi:hypothetical protein